MSDMRIQGAAYTAYGDLRPTNVADSKFIQTFFTSADEIAALSKACELTYLPKTKIIQNILRIIRGQLQDPEVSPLWEAYTTADNLLGEHVPNMRLIFTAKKTEITGHKRTYNMPQTGV